MEVYEATPPPKKKQYAFVPSSLLETQEKEEEAEEGAGRFDLCDTHHYEVALCPPDRKDSLQEPESDTEPLPPQ